jgi:hypothetical protein
MTLYEKKQEILKRVREGVFEDELSELLHDYEFLAVEPYLITPKFWTVLGRYTLRFMGLPFFIGIALIHIIAQFLYL